MTRTEVNEYYNNLSEAEKALFDKMAKEFRASFHLKRQREYGTDMKFGEVQSRELTACLFVFFRKQRKVFA